MYEDLNEDEDEENQNNEPIEFENKGYLTSMRSQVPPNNNTKNYENCHQFPTDNQSLLPKSTKQNKTSSKLAKPVTSPTSNNIYEPIFSEYEDPNEIKTPPTNTLSQVEVNQQPEYKNFSSMKQKPGSDDMYIDMKPQYAATFPLYE